MSGNVIELKHYWGKTEVEALLRKKLATASRRLDMSPPTVGLERSAKLMSFPPEQRHRIEEAFIDRVLKESLSLSPADPTPYDPEWLPTGEPRFGGTPAPALGLSLAHDESFCFCEIGNGSQGCDLDRVRPVNPEEWARLLGVAEPAFRQAIAEDASVELSAARLRAAMGAAWKALKSDKLELRFAGRFEEAVLLTARGPAGTEASILTLPIETDDGITRMFAARVEAAAPSSRTVEAHRARDAAPESSTA